MSRVRLFKALTAAAAVACVVDFAITGAPFMLFLAIFGFVPFALLGPPNERSTQEVLEQLLVIDVLRVAHLFIAAIVFLAYGALGVVFGVDSGAAPLSIAVALALVAVSWRPMDTMFESARKGSAGDADGR